MRRAMACGVKPALDDLRLEQEVKDELAKLAKDLLVLQTYLRDAENKQQTNETVRLWLENLQDVAYDANDVLDECALEAQRQKVIVLAQLRKSVSLINPKRSLFLHKVSRRERKIKERMEELQRQRQAYGLKIIEQESPPHRSESTSLGPPEIIGRDEDKANLVRMLTRSSGMAGEFNVSVVCIVGIGGLGKTTLAQSVYNDEAVEDNFTVRSWVHVSQDFREDKLTKKILESIDGSPHPNADNQHSDSSRADLRYRLLPAHLKPCFSFCSVFPIGFEFEEEELVRLWMSQSFIQPYDQDLRMEDVGRTYFDLLKQRSFFQFSRFDQKNNRSKYTIPESLHKFVRRGRRIAEHGNGFAKNRHLSLMPQEKPSLFNRQSVNDQLKGLYTLVIFDDSVTELPDDFTKKFERLRALDLSHTGIHKLPDSIHHLKHLRCLQLRGTNITRLPDALCCLYFLQTLGLQNCSMLEELPKEMKYLQCLRHIDLHWDHDSLMAPGHIPRFVVSEKKRCGVEELGNMTSLHGELLVSNLQLVRDAADAKAANLEGKEHLQCLELQWNAVDKEAAKFRRDLFGRDSVERALQDLEIQRCPSLSSLPEQFGFMKSLERLEISDCPSLLAMPSSFAHLASRLEHKQLPLAQGTVQGGEDDWPKIKNVFSVWVDGDVILPCRRT
ncbi:hypothetical protein HPP92_008319 [Vanilla planifolia]|uniref:Uncharacterized protein n=1 Tax=Vanilla planifolia TaxID=51239 RepID=A0A835RC55_VANPL|nr:hypothetical protein HPP92_008319 [Vanilla planifolia]